MFSWKRVQYPREEGRQRGNKPHSVAGVSSLIDRMPSKGVTELESARVGPRKGVRLLGVEQRERGMKGGSPSCAASRHCVTLQTCGCFQQKFILRHEYHAVGYERAFTGDYFRCNVKVIWSSKFIFRREYHAVGSEKSLPQWLFLMTFWSCSHRGYHLKKIENTELLFVDHWTRKRKTQTFPAK